MSDPFSEMKIMNSGNVKKDNRNLLSSPEKKETPINGDALLEDYDEYERLHPTELPLDDLLFDDESF